MQKNNPTDFSATELNNLLNRSFLESHLAKPEYKRITEAIAAHAMGISPVAISTQQQPFIKKLMNKMSLQILLIGFILIAAGIAGITFLTNSDEEPKKIDITPSAVYEQTIEESDNSKDSMQKSIPVKSNPAISHADMYEISATKNTTGSQTTYHDSAINNLTIQRLEPMYVEDAAILLPKDRDTTFANSKIIYDKNPRNDTTKKRRAQAKKREHDFKYTIDNLK